MTVFARITAFALALVIAATSQQFAAARGVAMSAAGEVVLCTGQGLVTVTLDDQGNPIGPVHICPDCVLSVMAFVPATDDLSAAVFHMQVLVQGAEAVIQTRSIHSLAKARAPPVVT